MKAKEIVAAHPPKPDDEHLIDIIEVLIVETHKLILDRRIKLSIAAVSVFKEIRQKWHAIVKLLGIDFATFESLYEGSLFACHPEWETFISQSRHDDAMLTLSRTVQARLKVRSNELRAKQAAL